MWVPGGTTRGGGVKNHTRALIHHVSRGGLCHVEDPLEVDAQYLVPFFWRDIKEVVTDADAGVVDQHVDRSHAINRRGKCSLYLFQARYVSVEHPGQLRQLLGNPSSCLGTMIEDANGAVLLQKARRGGLAYATGSTGHQHVLTIQSAHCSPPFICILFVLILHLPIALTILTNSSNPF